MKNTIMYYYNFDNPSIYRWHKKIYIKNNNDKYLFQRVYSEKEVVEIYNLIKNDANYYEFMFNKFNRLVTIYQGNQYVLLKLKKQRADYTTEIFNFNYVPSSKYSLDRTNWYFLWSQKNDYFEYQINHIYGKYHLIDESIDYYLGMAETAISYIKYNGLEISDTVESLSLCHKRITEEDIFNPLNIVIDNKERDLGEYLKYIFFNESYDEQKISDIINNSRCSKSGYHRLYARLLYPSYYFDIYEEIINENASEEELKKIIERVDEYEMYLQKIFQIIYQKTEIKRVDWIQKK